MFRRASCTKYNHLHNLVWVANLVEAKSKCEGGESANDNHATPGALQQLFNLTARLLLADNQQVSMQCTSGIPTAKPRTGSRYTAATCSSSWEAGKSEDGDEAASLAWPVLRRIPPAEDMTGKGRRE